MTGVTIARSLTAQCWISAPGVKTVRRTGWVVMAVLASLVAAYAVAILAVPAWAPPFLAERRAVMPLAVAAHISGGLWALAVGPWQLNQRVRSHIVVHRWIGRSYFAAILVGGVGALVPLPRSPRQARSPGSGSARLVSCGSPSPSPRSFESGNAIARLIAAG